MYFAQNNLNTTIRTIKVLHTPNGKSVWRFCATSDGSYIARKNGWQDVKSFASWKQLLFQYNRWLTYTNAEGNKTFVAGYPRKSEEATPQEAPLSTLEQEAADCL